MQTLDTNLRTYEAAVLVHREIEALYPEVERQHVWLRGLQRVGRNVPVPPGINPGVETDRLFCALAIKAATTARSVLTLCEAGDGDNAYALARVVIENGVLMRCLLGGPGRDRLETYALFTSVMHERTVSLIAQYFPPHQGLGQAARPLRTDAYHRAITKATFRGHTNTWAYFPVPGKREKLKQVRIAEIFAETQDSFGYEGPYADGSQYIHSGPSSLFGIMATVLDSGIFKLEPAPSTTNRGTALLFSNAGQLVAFDALMSRRG